MGNDVEMGSLFTNPIIILPKGDTVKLVIDARYLNSITDLTNYSWPLEPVQMLLTRLDGVYYTTSDLASAYNQVPLTEDTKKLTSFIVGGKQYMFERGFYGLCGLPNFFSRIMTIHFAEMIAKKQVITYIDDVILQAKTKQEMWNNLDSYFKCLRSSGLKAAPNKTKLFLRKVQFLGHIVSDKGIQPVAKKVQDLKNLKSPENKRDVMRILGSLGFYSTFIKNLHVDSKPFYELLRDDTPFKWTKEHENLFQDIKNRISEETILAVPNPKYPFHIHVDSSSIGTGSILIQDFPSGKRIVSFNSRVFTKDEQKMSTLHRELCGIISALQTYEHFIIGSRHPIKVFCDHKPLLYLWARKGRLSHRFFRYQVIITQFTNLQIIWTPGKNLAFPDLLSRNVSLKDLNGHQLLHKEIPKDIKFFSQSGHEVQYLIDHNSPAESANDDFYPIVCTHLGETKKLHLKNDGTDLICTVYDPNSPKALFDVSDSFREGKDINIRRKWQTPPIVVEADVHENHYSEIDSETDNSDNEASDEDPLLNTEVVNASKEDVPFILSIFTIQDSQQPLKLVTDNLDLNNILANQQDDPVLSTVKSWIIKGKVPSKDVESRQCKGLLGYSNQFEKLFIDEETHLVCKTSKHSSRQICLPRNCFIEAFNVAHDHRLSGHPGCEKTLLSLKRFFYWPGMYKWVRTLTKSCLICRKNKQVRKDQNTAPNEKWGEEIPYPFHTVHIDHKGPLNPMSDGKHHCLVVIDAFSRFIQVYPVKSTDASNTIEAMTSFITSFGIPQKLVYDRGTSFMSTDFSTFLLDLGITHAPRTKWSPWTNGKVEIQNKHLSRYFRCYLSEAGNNWAKLAPQFAFAHNTSVNASTGATPYEVVFGFKPQIPISLKLGLVRDDNDLCQSEFCQSLPDHSHLNKDTKHSCIDSLLTSKCSLDLLHRETQFKNIYRKVYTKVRKANHRSLPYRNKYKLAKPLRVGQKVLLENHQVPFGKSQKLCELRSGPYTVTKVITKVNYEVALDSDPTRIHVVHRNHLVEFFPRNNDLPTLLSNYEKPVNDDRTEHFYNEYAKNRLSELNKPIETLAERQHVQEYLPIFPDTPGPSRMNTTYSSPAKCGSAHSTPTFLASSPDSGIPQSSPQTPISFQGESPAITSQPTTPSPLPRNIPSTSTAAAPRSRNTGTLRNIPREWYGKPYF